MEELFKKDIWYDDEARDMIEDILSSIEDILAGLGEYKQTKDEYKSLVEIQTSLQDFIDEWEKMDRDREEERQNIEYYKRTHRGGYAPFNPFTAYFDNRNED